jgi:hypothetical protein
MELLLIHYRLSLFKLSLMIYARPPTQLLGFVIEWMKKLCCAPATLERVVETLVKVILAVHSSMVMVCKLGSYHGVWDVEEVNFLEYTPVPVD